jgi:putative transcriptional regulator
MNQRELRNGRKTVARPSVGTRIIEGLQELVSVLEKREPLHKHFTCRQIRLDLKPMPYNGRRVKETRGLLGASQAVFAGFLGVSVKTIRAWEQGVNTPNGMACRFMDEIRRDPKHWLARLREAVVVK